MSAIWNSLPQQLRTAIVSAVLIIIGAATEALVSWLESLSNTV